LSKKARFWVMGIIIAALGVILARLIPGFYPDQPNLHLTLFIIGVVIAITGLGIILAGLRK
jgi:hypothetical protein